MRHAIKCTCSHCQRETYFDASLGLEAISGSTCARCGHTGAVITLNIEPPGDAMIQDQIPRVAQLTRDPDLRSDDRRRAN
jgi:hypothetical protein